MLQSHISTNLGNVQLYENVDYYNEAAIQEDMSKHIFSTYKYDHKITIKIDSLTVVDG